MRYPFLLFDAGETLFAPREPFGATYARVLARLGLDLPTARLEEGIRASWRELDRQVPRGQDRYGWFPEGERGYWLEFARGAIERAAGRPISVELAGEVLEPLREAFRAPEAWRVFPDVVPALDALRSDGVRLGIVSNWDSRLPALLSRLGLAPRFDAVIVSRIVGVEKPSPRIFEIALREMGAPADSTLHVGDVPELDADGARAAGIDALLVDRQTRLGFRTDTIPDFSVLPAIAREGLPFRSPSRA